MGIGTVAFLVEPTSTQKTPTLVWGPDFDSQQATLVWGPGFDSHQFQILIQGTSYSTIYNRSHVFVFRPLIISTT